MKVVRPSLRLLWFLLGSSLALDCDWHSWEDRGLNLNSSQPELGSPTDVANAEECKAACCFKPGCDVALVGRPQDGPLQCYLVTCWTRESDRCQLVNSSQFQVHRRKVRSGSVSPLLGEPEEEQKIQIQKQKQARCRLPMKVGFCRASFPRFFYNVTSQRCEVFNYGGCDGNANNFESKKDCEAACAGVTGPVLPDESKSAHEKAPRMAPGLQGDWSEMTSVFLSTPKVMSSEDYAEHCGAEPAVGPCRAAIPRWYYERQEGTCKRFIYGGCRGNQNNYMTEQRCMDTCAGVTVLPASKKTSSADHLAGNCVQKPDAGPCRAAFTMFYYDPDTNSCLPFVYGGCRGNGNRYDSREECLERCLSDGWVSSGRAGNRWTAGLFFFITLAAISALLLAALIIFTLKRRGFTRVSSSVSDKQELLPEKEDQLSVESLSLPESPKANQA